MTITRTKKGELLIDNHGFTLCCRKDPEFGGYVATVLIMDYLCGRANDEKKAVEACLSNNVPTLASTFSSAMHILRNLDNYEFSEDAVVGEDVLAVI